MRARVLARLDGAGDGHRGAAHGVEQGGTAGHRREAAGAEEILVARRARGEGVAFMHEAADGDAHGRRPLTRCRLQHQLHEYEIEPAVELAADLGETSGLDEAERGVQAQ